MEEPDFDDFFDELSPEETELIIEYLVEHGAAEWDGMDQYGERMFKFNMDKLGEVMPELYSQIMQDLDETLLSLFEKGLVNVDYNEDLEAYIHISEEGKKVMKEMGIDYLLDDD